MPTEQLPCRRSRYYRVHRFCPKGRARWRGSSLQRVSAFWSIASRCQLLRDLQNGRTGRPKQCRMGESHQVRREREFSLYGCHVPLTSVRKHGDSQHIALQGASTTGWQNGIPGMDCTKKPARDESSDTSSFFSGVFQRCIPATGCVVPQGLLSLFQQVPLAFRFAVQFSNATHS